MTGRYQNDRDGVPCCPKRRSRETHTHTHAQARTRPHSPLPVTGRTAPARTAKGIYLFWGGARVAKLHPAAVAAPTAAAASCRRQQSAGRVRAAVIRGKPRGSPCVGHVAQGGPDAGAPADAGDDVGAGDLADRRGEGVSGRDARHDGEERGVLPGRARQAALRPGPARHPGRRVGGGVRRQDAAGVAGDCDGAVGEPVACQRARPVAVRQREEGD